MDEGSSIKNAPSASDLAQASQDDQSKTPPWKAILKAKIRRDYEFQRKNSHLLSGGTIKMQGSEVVIIPPMKVPSKNVEGSVRRQKKKDEGISMNNAPTLAQDDDLADLAQARPDDQSKTPPRKEIQKAKIRRDYEFQLKNSHLLSEGARKLQGSEVVSKPQVAQHKAASKATTAENPLTITPHDFHSSPSLSNEWPKPPQIDEREFEASGSEEGGEVARKRKIFENLIEIERSKRHLLQEYGSDFPYDEFYARVRLLFDDNNQATTPSTTSQGRAAACLSAAQQHVPPAPTGTQVINPCGVNCSIVKSDFTIEV